MKLIPHIYFKKEPGLLKLLCTCLAGLLLPFICQGQLSEKKIAQVNQFNRLFGDYFYVNDYLEIRKVDPAMPGTFASYYDLVKQQNWNSASKYIHNLDSSTELRSPYRNVITLNIKFNQDGVYYPDLSGGAYSTAFNKEFKKAGDRFYLTEKIQEKCMQGCSSDTSRTPVFQDSLLRANNLDPVNDKNGYELHRLSDAIYDRMKAQNIHHAYIFIHGYNVPHSLAQMQGNRIIRQLHNKYPDSTFLFIRVFWEAGTAKKLDVNTREKNGITYLDNMVYKDRITLKNGLNFFTKRQDGITCAYSLRRLLIELNRHPGNAGMRYHMVTHSLGGIVAANCLINNMSLLKYKHCRIEELAEQKNYVVDSAFVQDVYALINGKRHRLPTWLWLKKRKKSSEFITFLKTHYQLPGLHMDVFMNAPALPGVELFKWADMSQYYQFTVGHNLYDPVLAKRFIFKNVLISGKLSNGLGTTSLGLNYNNESGMTEYLVDTRPQPKHFTFNGYRTSSFFEHDIFAYMSHPMFIYVFNQYLEIK